MFPIKKTLQLSDALWTGLVLCAVYQFSILIPLSSEAQEQHLRTKSLMVNPKAVLKYDEREYTYDDFEWKFGVHPLHYTLWDNELSQVLEAHDPTMDPVFRSNPQRMHHWSQMYCPFVQDGSHEESERDRFVIRFSSPETGYGLYTQQSLKKGEIVGEYIGIGNKGARNKKTDYEWYYPSKHIPGYELGIDANKFGNYMRFVNHGTPAQRNVDMVYCLCNDRYHVMYIASRDIHAKEELLTSYGDQYFKTRNK
ncbi:hypothetical protein EDD86DRAFT_248780 [Gorgonomyces haynaldii]|nr:hypothetical protein EDD86DRAFT_248780 [Gorgonomyces haynaldii]